MKEFEEKKKIADKVLFSREYLNVLRAVKSLKH